MIFYIEIAGILRQSLGLAECGIVWFGDLIKVYFISGYFRSQTKPIQLKSEVSSSLERFSFIVVSKNFFPDDCNKSSLLISYIGLKLHFIALQLGGIRGNPYDMNYVG